ncbi:zinc metalloprotease [Aquimarina brevivitae]|uniref:Pregnancy-associated plasma protein-A n=1 Tax=Aquimarina brevivitae TaxID=323412 RepID=A0A4Q7PFS8_9FLAO|nr:zinc metalloprotease [Aquimarina brevivitae]RZS99363.1 pregnancy-associated plasma protein-A [Aquimarina brevivitae]
MKKLFLGFAALGLILASCQKDEFANEQEQIDYNGEISGKSRICKSHEILEKQIAKNPKRLELLEQIENQTKSLILAKKPGGGNGNGNGPGGGGGNDNEPPTDFPVVTIPVYVHVIYNTSQENISEAQIDSQIQVLNDDFRMTNSDSNQIPTEFADRAADTQIQFTLAGVTRTFSERTSWGTRDDMKRSSQGGVDPIDPANYLNIWVCNIGGGILGYAQFPGGSLDTDGVVVGPQFFGTQGYLAAPFNEGRTTTHEVGHYLNLRHIWGDGRCRQDDFVADTPDSDRANYGCPSYPTNHCKSNDMTMNYMDYVDDACMYMFSNGQKLRMRAVLEPGSIRSDLVN